MPVRRPSLVHDLRHRLRCEVVRLVAHDLEDVALPVLERRVLDQELHHVALRVFIVYLALRFADVAYRGALPLAFQPSWVTASFWVENLLFAAPIVLVWSEASRRSPRRIFLAACAMVGAGLLYRLGSFLIAYDTGAGWRYFPSLGELAVTIGLISFEVLAITAAIRWLPILPKVPPGALAHSR